MKNKEVEEVDATGKKKVLAKVKAFEYNLITQGKYKGWYSITHLIPPGGTSMPIFTKPQQTYLDNEFGKVHQRIDVLEKKVDALDKKFTNKFNELEKKVDTNSKKIDALDKKVDANSKKIDALDRKVDKVLETIVNLFKINNLKTE